ncbi:uncharacterized protein JN550_011974 [Neoarthrinium moseri]|uniref:uncharacterized protein n=1 Tax=Neoarthrinium moseri TaxID=1658444 RepID=UPI001FDE0406|nr:uncharacterized protein JN550_011974 [Neoarthrinium moseri]KAI1859566.1 hypothetical protein JN550_011974 [Neoarthrinium moseri]
MGSLANTTGITPAQLLSVETYTDAQSKTNPYFWIVTAKLRTRLDHRPWSPQFSDLFLTLKAKIVLGFKDKESLLYDPNELRILLARRIRTRVYLCGGPGDQNPPDRNPEFNRRYVEAGESIVFLDYRGTGGSVQVTNAAGDLDQDCMRFMRLLRPQDHAADGKTALADDNVDRLTGFLKLCRQDSIIRDLEAIRLALLPLGQRWHIFGQSYGGWLSLTYLSLCPKGLADSTITAGLAPITVSVDTTYRALFKVVIGRNDLYYTTYPEDVKRVKTITLHLLSQETPSDTGIELPRGGLLTAQRFLSLGRVLGNRARFAQVHNLIKAMSRDLETSSPLTLDSLANFERVDTWKFDERPVYALLHEAMYCRQGEVSNWSAERVSMEFPQYTWVARDEISGRNWREALIKNCARDAPKVYFSGEMVYPFHFRTYRALRPLVEVADRLAKHRWDEQTYSARQLRANQVPVYAVSYTSDMHVHPRLSEETATCVAGIEHEVLDVANGKLLEHGSVRSHTAEVMGKIDGLRAGYWSRRGQMDPTGNTW